MLLTSTNTTFLYCLLAFSMLQAVVIICFVLQQTVISKHGRTSANSTQHTDDKTQRNAQQDAAASLAAKKKARDYSYLLQQVIIRVNKMEQRYTDLAERLREDHSSVKLVNRLDDVEKKLQAFDNWTANKKSDGNENVEASVGKSATPSVDSSKDSRTSSCTTEVTAPVNNSTPTAGDVQGCLPSTYTLCFGTWRKETPPGSSAVHRSLMEAHALCNKSGPSCSLRPTASPVASVSINEGCTTKMDGVRLSQENAATTLASKSGTKSMDVTDTQGTMEVDGSNKLRARLRGFGNFVRRLSNASRRRDAQDATNCVRQTAAPASTDSQLNAAAAQQAANTADCGASPETTVPGSDDMVAGKVAVALALVEEAMGCHPAVEVARAFMVPNACPGAKVYCVVALRRKTPVSEEWLRLHAMEKLPSEYVPQGFLLKKGLKATESRTLLSQDRTLKAISGLIGAKSRWRIRAGSWARCIKRLQRSR